MRHSCTPATRGRENLPPGSFPYYMSKSRAGKFSVRETDCGTSYGMYRPAEEDSYYWRTGHLLFPCFAMPPVPTLGVESRFLAYVPMDDENTLEWSIGPGANEGLGAGFMVGREYLNNGTGWYDRYVIEQTFENDFQIDREAQRTMKSWSGIAGVRQQDMAMTEGMGPILDRTNEHLGTTDQMIIRTRRRPTGSRPRARRGRRTAPRRRQPSLIPQALRPSHPPPHRRLVGGHPPPS